MFELIKTLGSLVGLLTGIVFFYDRFAKGRPVASLSFKDDENKSAYLRVNNPSDYPIAIVGMTVTPDVFGITEDLEIRTILKGATGTMPSFFMEPGSSKDLYLISKYSEGEGVPREYYANRIKFCIEWRRGNTTWIPQLPVCIRTDMRTIRRFSMDKRNYT